MKERGIFEGFSLFSPFFLFDFSFVSSFLVVVLVIFLFKYCYDCPVGQLLLWGGFLFRRIIEKGDKTTKTSHFFSILFSFIFIFFP